MLIFYCTDCNETINGADTESPDGILDRLEEHVVRCPLATFTFEATTEFAKQREEGLRAALNNARLAGKIRLH